MTSSLSTLARGHLGSTIQKLENACVLLSNTYYDTYIVDILIIKLEQEADEEVPGNEFRRLGQEDVACFDNLADLGCWVLIQAAEPAIKHKFKHN